MSKGEIASYNFSFSHIVFHSYISFKCVKKRHCVVMALMNVCMQVLLQKAITE